MDTFQSIFDGLMLSDGSLCKQRDNARYQHTCKYKSYVDYLLDISKDYGLFYSENCPTVRTDISVRWAIASRVDTRLTEQYFRWYDLGKKIVPEDVCLSPANVLHLYIGDGSLAWNKTYLHGLEISVQGFALPYRLFLKEKLTQLGFPFRMDTVGKFGLKKSVVPSFLEWIGKPPFHCYDYKWMIEDREEYNRLRHDPQYLVDNQQPVSRKGGEEGSTTIP